MSKQTPFVAKDFALFSSVSNSSTAPSRATIAAEAATTYAGAKRSSTSFHSSKSAAATTSSTAAGSTVPAYKFVRTDPTQARINDIFKVVSSQNNTAAPAPAPNASLRESIHSDSDAFPNDRLVRTTATATATAPAPVRHKRDCMLLQDMQYCEVIGSGIGSGSSDGVETGAINEQRPLGTGAMLASGDSSFACNCCITLATDDEDNNIMEDGYIDTNINNSDCVEGNGYEQLSNGLISNQSVDGMISVIGKYDIIETSCQYHSVLTLLQDIQSNRDHELESILRLHSFVGVVDSTSCLIQVGLKLLLVNYSILCRNLCTQLVIRQFGELPAIKFESPVSLVACMEEIAMHVYPEEMTQQQQHSSSTPSMDLLLSLRSSWVTENVKLLLSKSDMLLEYFQIGFTSQHDGDGALISLPQIIPGYVPDLSAIPTFLALLCTKVNWNDELSCFRGVAEQLGFLYSFLSESQESTATSPSNEVAANESNLDRGKGLLPLTSVSLTAQAEHAFLSFLYPCLKKHYVPSKADADSIVMIASLAELYKVFERC